MRRYLSLLRYARPHRRGWAGIALLSLGLSGIALLQPWPMKVLVDHVLGGRPMSEGARRVVAALPGAGTPGGMVGWVVASGLVLFALTSLLEVRLTCSWIRVGQAMVYDLAADLFARIQRRSLLFHARHPVGDSMSRVTGDAWCVDRLVDSLVLTPLQSAAFIAAVGLVMASMDVPMTLVSFAVAPAMAVATVLLGRRLRRIGRVRRESESRVQSHVQQTLTGIQVVQAFGQEEREHARFQAYAADVIRANQRATAAGNLSGLWTGLVLTLGTGTVLWIGGRRVLAGDLTLGALLVFLAYLGSLQDRMKRLVTVYNGLQSAGAQVDRVREVLDAEPEVRDAPDAAPVGAVRGAVRLDGVTFGYEPGRPALREVSLEARPGQTVAIVGPTGAGKSTLVALIPRFADPWEGTVSLDGRDVRGLRLRELRRNVSLVLQEPFLFPGSVAENVALGRPGATREEIRRALEAANADAFVRALPQGYDTPIGPRGLTLSGGERQRLSIARALLKDAPVLILDEPTSALDPRTEALLVDAVERLMRGRTTFLIAHRLSTIRRADLIAVLDAGRLVERGTHDELLRLGGLYARLHALQTGAAS